MKPRLTYVSQVDQNDCGLACVAMILSSFGKTVSLSELEEVCPYGRDGINAAAIVEASRHFGLRAQVYSAPDGRILSEDLPVIVHWKLTHWVVLTRITVNSVFIIDPSGGAAELSKEEYFKYFSGIFIRFTRTPSFVKGKATRSRPFLQLLKRSTSTTVGVTGVVLIIALSTILQLLSFGLPIGLKLFVDDVLPREDRSIIVVLASALAFLALAQGIAIVLRGFVLTRARILIDSAVMNDIVNRLLNAPITFFQRHAAADLLSRVNTHSNIRQVMSEWILTTILDGTLVVLYLLALYATDWRVASICMGGVLIQTAALIATRAKLRFLAYGIAATNSEHTNFLYQLLGSVRAMKACGASEHIQRRWRGLLNLQLTKESQQGSITSILNGIAFVADNGAKLGVMCCGAVLVIEHHMTLGTLLMTMTYTAGLFTPLTRCAYSVLQLHSVAASIYRLDAVVQAPREWIEQSTPHVRWDEHAFQQHGILVSGLTYRYPGSKLVALDSVSLKIRPGQKVAIVGATGAGKSTLVSMLLMFDRPESGCVRFGGIELSPTTVLELRQHIGAVLQDAGLFRGTIRDNLTLGFGGVTETDLVNAAKAAQIHNEVLRFPMGYETLLSDGATNISGGQRQRLALARALIRRPDILILDEATSNMDAETEARINLAIDELSCTRIVISHRLSTISNADCIFVLQGGRVVEHGSHAELVGQKGVYTTLMMISDAPVDHQKSKLGKICCEETT